MSKYANTTGKDFSQDVLELDVHWADDYPMSRLDASHLGEQITVAADVVHYNIPLPLLLQGD